jgi:hypothetical protein
MTASENKTKKPRRKGLFRVLKVAALTVFGVLLFVYGLLAVTVSILTPERLTPLVERIATASLQDAEVHIDKVELSMRKQFPFLSAEIVNLSVVSTKMQHLSADMHRDVPQWADTVVSVNRFEGGMNIGALLLYKVSLSDVTIDGPSMNAVVVNDSICNYDIVAPSEEPSEPFDWTSLPTIELTRFQIVNPRPLRYLDVPSDTYLCLNFKEASLSGKDAPLYHLDFTGNIATPMVSQYLKLKDIEFALKGDLIWDQDTPYKVTVNNMGFELPLLKGKLNTDVNFKEDLIVETLKLNFDPIQIEDAIDLLPDSLRREYSIPDGIETNAKVILSAELAEPYNVSGTALPHGRVSINVPDAQFTWQDVRLDNLAANVDIDMPNDNLDNVTVDIKSIKVSGPATDLTIKGTVTNLMTDPLFDGNITGTCDLAKLPPVLSSMIPGSLSGYLEANARIVGRPSMFTPQDFHRLKVEGDLTVDKLLWQNSDSVDCRVFAHHAQFTFGTNSKSAKDGKVTDSLLTAKIVVDSASVDQDDISMHVVDLSFGVGAVNKYRRSGDRSIVPMGGGLRMGKFNMRMESDSTTLRVKDVAGTAVMRSHNNDYKTPEFIFDLGIGRVSCGSPTTRMMFSKAKTNLVAYVEPQGKQAKAISKLCDSIKHAEPEMQLDSVYDLASRIYSSMNVKRQNAVEVDSTEVFDLGVDVGIKRVLLGWAFKGTLSAEKAGMFTPYFPLRNRLRNVNMTFNNDSVVMHDVTYKAGRSDFKVSGAISNIRRALTSRNRSPLKIKFNMQSDTIDVNQLAEAAFAGSDYANRSEEERRKLSLADTDNETQLEKAITAQANAVDTMTAFLVPKNIDADLKVHAHHVIYSDLLLQHMNGRVQVYDGAINMQDLSAKSDVGSVGLTALYMGRSVNELKFGFGMKVDKFNINRFLQLVPAVDSIMPILRDFSGIVSADIAATSNITPSMDIDMPTLQAAIKLSGDSLVLIDPETFKIMAKWLMFKDKGKNVIDHMDVQLTVEDNKMQLYPFIFDFDRYRLGVQGTNDLAMNFNYHVAVLKSPIPFKFGINIKGNPDKYKIRLGRAKLNEKTALQVTTIDTTRVNLVRQIQNVFRRGVRNSNFARVDVDGIRRAAAVNSEEDDTLSHLDSLRFIQEGLIEAPDTLPSQEVLKEKAQKRKSSKKQSKVSNTAAAAGAGTAAAVVMLAVLRRRREDEN